MRTHVLAIAAAGAMLLGAGPAGAQSIRDVPEAGNAFCDLLEDGMAEASANGLQDAVTVFATIYDETGCDEAPGGGGAPALPADPSELCAALGDVKEAAAGTPVVDVATEVEKVLECPPDEPPPTTTTTAPAPTTTTTVADDDGNEEGSSRGTGEGGGTARGADVLGSTSDLAGDTSGAGSLPRTGGVSVLAPIGLGFAGLAAILRRFALPKIM